MGPHIAQYKKLELLRATMTPEVSRIMSPDLYVDNESLVFDHDRAESLCRPAPPLAAVSFVATTEGLPERLPELARACGDEAASFVAALSSPRQGWLFVADGPWREATSLVLHRRLWKNRVSLGESQVGGRRSEEVAIRNGRNVRYAGVVEVTPELMDQAVDIVRTDHACAIIFSSRVDMTDPANIETIFRTAFSSAGGGGGMDVDWLALAVSLCPRGDVLLRVSGLFDDREAAVDLIATPENLSTR